MLAPSPWRTPPNSILFGVDAVGFNAMPQTSRGIVVEALEMYGASPPSVTYSPRAQAVIAEQASELFESLLALPIRSRAITGAS